MELHTNPVILTPIHLLSLNMICDHSNYFVQILTSFRFSTGHSTLLSLIFTITIFFLTFLSLENQQNNKSNFITAFADFQCANTFTMADFSLPP